MIGIVIVAHGGLAHEYLAALEHVVGKRPGTVAVAIGAEDDCGSKQAEIAAAVESVDQGQGVVVVTDMFGSTPSNLALGACRRADRKVLCGVNMPLLVQLSQSRRMSLKEAVASSLTAGRKYINCIDGLRPNGSPLAL